MISGEFIAFPIDSIVINREGRQRRELVGVEELAASIKEVGLLHPVIVTREGVLVAGERRLEAHKLLGYTDILIQWADTIDPTDLHLIELEENVKREQLSWQDETRAVEEYHRLLTERNPGQTMTQTAEALGVDQAFVSRRIMVAEEMRKNEDVAAISHFTSAHSLVARRRERAATSEIAETIASVLSPAPESTKRVALLHADFTQWAKTVQKVPFNFLHLDFPYGVKVGDSKGRTAAKTHGAYDDSEDIYWHLMETLSANLDNFCAPSAHMMFWFSMKFYQPTMDALRAMGWAVNPTPLIWAKSDNVGILVDPNRGPRQVYETAFLCSRGDRKIVRATGNVAWLPTTKEFHTSEKSKAMLLHFFRMFIDESSLVLDPTCGSGMAIKAAEESGAAYALGLEKDLDFYHGACKNVGLGDSINV